MKTVDSSLLKSPSVREAPLYERLRDDKVRCETCARKCLIPRGLRGFCKTRVNIDGKLYTIVYGDLNAIESRPIEIKPFFHFWPGSTALTFSTWSCNLYCLWCQNWHLSKEEPDPYRPNYVPPDKLVDMARKVGDEGLCVSFTEPLMLFEYSLDVFKLGRAAGLYNTFVSNGCLTSRALEMLKEAGLDAIKIDVKGGREVYRRFCAAPSDEPVWEAIREARKLNLHVEVVNLIVTGVNDDEDQIRELARKHLKELGPYAPIHFTRYYPAFKFKSPSTSISKLEAAYRVAREEGLFYVYLGNVPGHSYENTYCHECSSLIIRRGGL